LIAELAEILHYAHQQGFIHRDIKPGNILLDAEGKPYLADFGIAISEDEGEGRGHGTAGTLAYMPPEQLSDGASRIDVRMDIYGLGVVLYELLTGQKPFTGNNPLDLRNAILSAQPTPPRAIDANLPQALERICLKAMAKDPAERYATAKDYASALKAVIGPTRWKFWFAGSLLAVLLSALLVVSILRTWTPNVEKGPNETATPPHSPATTEELAKEIKTFAETHPEAKPAPRYDSVLKQQEAVKRIMQRTREKYGLSP
jgi:serine/threonine protein kinase